MWRFRFIFEKIPYISFHTPGLFWFRWLGYGLHGKRLKDYSLLFSERHKKNGIQILGWYFKLLKPSFNYRLNCWGTPRMFSVHNRLRALGRMLGRQNRERLSKWNWLSIDLKHPQVDEK